MKKKTTERRRKNVKWNEFYDYLLLYYKFIYICFFVVVVAVAAVLFYRIFCSVCHFSRLSHIFACKKFFFFLYFLSKFWCIFFYLKLLYSTQTASYCQFNLWSYRGSWVDKFWSIWIGFSSACIAATKYVANCCWITDGIAPIRFSFEYFIYELFSVKFKINFSLSIKRQFKTTLFLSDINGRNSLFPFVFIILDGKCKKIFKRRK